MLPTLLVPASSAPAAPSFVVDHLPSALLTSGPLGLLWWQWLGVVVLLLLAWALGRLLSWVSTGLLRRITMRTRATWDDLLLTRLTPPITLVWTLVVAASGFHYLAVPAASQPVFDHALRIGFFVAFFMCLVRSVDVLVQVLATSRWARERPSSRSLLSLASRVGKVALIAIAVIAVVSELGYPVASLIAGLGIGGLAFALAAQKTVENLFGAFSLGVDQPFREGDSVRVDNSFSGTVETIGLRSTRFRTADRTLITIPNGKLAEMRIESFAARDRFRFFCALPLTYDTPADTLRSILGRLEQALRDVPQVASSSPSVRLVRLGESSMDIEASALFHVPEAEFGLIRQELLLTFLQIIEAAGARLAFPTRTVHLQTASSAVQQR